MANQNVFNDIAIRTQGDIYIGVVGPVRCGKSTFITKFMKAMIVPKITTPAEQQRVIDELPQSADGTGIMTTQPKFVPAKAVSIKSGAANMRVRLIDCVGYLVPGATGNQIDGKIRNVKTPWSEGEMPFEKAAELGTKKVITEHSTIAVCITTDGTITDIPRTNYVEAEEKCINQLKKCGKPFIVVVNSKLPNSTECRKIATQISEKHDVTALSMDVENLSNENIHQILGAVLHEFGVSGFRVLMPKWLQVLDVSHEIIAEAVESLKSHTKNIRRLSDSDTSRVFKESSHYAALETAGIDVATGIVTYNIVPKPELYYRVLSAECGQVITSEQELVAYIKHCGAIKIEYDKIKDALAQAEATGYGIVTPSVKDYNLEQPVLHKSGKNYGVKLKASASSLHIVKVDVATEVTPTIGTHGQSEEMLKFLTSEYQNNKDAIWNTNIFGKNLNTLVAEGINGKVSKMPPEAQKKIKRTLGRIVNNGRGGIICIIL